MIGNRVWCHDTARFATVISRHNGVTVVEYTSGDTAKGRIIDGRKIFKHLRDQ